MTFYKNLGPIAFECETQQLQIFSGSNSTLIVQFKHYSDVDFDCIASFMTVYQLILKQQNLLQLYSEKNKPMSILLHKAVPVAFQRINVHLLCQIIKQMATSIFQTRKITQNKIGEITKQLFFQIDGNLRYLYLPVQNCPLEQKDIVSNMVEFFNTLKDEKEVSHRLLLKKIQKCVSIQSVIEETDYFLSIYHSKQTAIQTRPQAATSQQTFFTKTIKNPYLNPTKTVTQNNKFKGFNPMGRNTDINNGKNTTRRKYNLFKDTEIKSFRNTNYSSHINLSTWRKNDGQPDDQNATFRSNSKALHLDITQRSTKKTSSSLFQKNNFLSQSQQKFSNRKLFQASSHTQNQNNLSSKNEQFVRSKSRKNSNHQENSPLNVYQQSSGQKQSRISQNLEESMTRSKQIVSSQNLNNGSSSECMKQMVNNSLQKWRQKSKDKTNVFSRIKNQDKQRLSTTQSRTKVIEKNQQKNYEENKEKMISQDKNTFFKSSGENFAQSTQMTTYTQTVSDNKLKKGEFNNRSTFIEISQQQIQDSKLLARNSQDFQFQFHQNLIAQQIVPEPKFTQNFEESLEQIKLNQSSIEEITLKNKREQYELKQKKLINDTSVDSINHKKPAKKSLKSKEVEKPQTIKNTKKDARYSQENDFSKKETEKNIKLLQFQSQQKQISLKKQQIDFIGVAVVQTTDHLKSFQSIFWQLPMFFLYKKFYEKRLQLSKNINQLLTNINSCKSKQTKIQQLAIQVGKNSQQISEENENIEQSLKKLLKTVKKKIKKEYPQKQEQQYVDKHLHLDFSIKYDAAIDQFISMYLQSLLEAKTQFPELVFHIIDIFQAVSVCKGYHVDTKLKQTFNLSDKKPQNISKAQKYFTALLKKKQIQALIQPQKKSKAKK